MSKMDAEFEAKAAEIAVQFPEGLVAYLRNQRDSLGRYVRDEGWLDLVNKRDADLADARTQIERLEARNVALERVAEIIANPAADAAHTIRCIEKGWQDRGEGCYCQQDPRDPDDVLTEARVALAALEDTTDG